MASTAFGCSWEQHSAALTLVALLIVIALTSLRFVWRIDTGTAAILATAAASAASLDAIATRTPATARAVGPESLDPSVLERLEHADRLRMAGEMSIAIAETLATPLTVLAGRLNEVRADPDVPERAKRYTDVSIDQTSRINAALLPLVAFGRGDGAGFRPLNVGELAVEAKPLIGPLLARRHVSLDLSLDAALPNVVGDPPRLLQLMANLALNAAQATELGGVVTLNVRGEERRETNGPGSAIHKRVVIEVVDRGVGFSATDRQRLYEPFFSTKPPPAAGLGLTIVRGIAVAHDGFMEEESALGAGSVFRCVLPVAAA